MAKISTWPVLNRWRLLSPQAPIVINNTQTVRVTDNGDAGQISQQVKSKLAAIAYVLNGSVVQSGTAVNLTSDGSFVTAGSNFILKPAGTYFVVLSDGTQAAISQITEDPAISLAFFKANLNGVPVQNLGDSHNILPGDKLFFLQNSLQNFTAETNTGIVTSGQDDIEGAIFMSDYPRRSFGIDSTSTLSGGEAVLDGSGNIQAIWNGSGLISSDVLKTAMVLYFNNQSQIIRPSFGFNYSIVTQTDSRLAGNTQGALVKSVLVSGAAHAAGLEPGDIITSIDNQVISESNPLEQLLENYKPGDTATLSVSRGKVQVALKLKVTQLK